MYNRTYICEKGLYGPPPGTFNLNVRDFVSFARPILRGHHKKEKKKRKIKNPLEHLRWTDPRMSLKRKNSILFLTAQSHRGRAHRKPSKHI